MATRDAVDTERATESEVRNERDSVWNDGLSDVMIDKGLTDRSGKEYLSCDVRWGIERRTERKWRRLYTSQDETFSSIC